MIKPIILVVSDRESVMSGLVRDFRRRFAADYRVLGRASAASALATLTRAPRQQAELALLIVDEHLQGSGALDFLSRAHPLAPTAKRVLLVDRGNWSTAHPVIAAITLGQVDYHLYNPWWPLERILYASVAEMLAAWDRLREATDVPVRIVGERWSAGSHEVRDTLTRVGVPYWFHDHDSPAGQQLLQQVAADDSRLPVLVFSEGPVLAKPTAAEVWQALGVQTRTEVNTCDVAVIGAGPAGLAAAVYASSEGLATLVLERGVPGGQAGTSSLIRNYLGFHRGVSGDDLANRAVEQAWLFGANFVLSQAATALRVHGSQRVLTLSDGSHVAAQAVILAMGVAWRRLGIPELDALVGCGVFYGAAGAEARAMTGREVFVVGAGNSAGQAAMHLARYAKSVTMLVRGNSLRASMSEYLVTEIESATNVNVRVRTEVAGGEGRGQLEALLLHDREAGVLQRVPASALFLLIGAEPRTEWLAGSVERDTRGYVVTGRDLLTAGHRQAWPLDRLPLRFETSVPGVFAAGDVRHGSIKRVAAAVGEGSTAIQVVHEYLSLHSPVDA
jgi:thioredoxin reductase (NADPH)